MSYVLGKLETAVDLCVLITGRESPELDDHLQNLQLGDSHAVRLRLSPSDTWSDLDVFIQSKLTSWPSRNDNNKQTLASKVLERSNGCFLWAALVLDRISKSHGKEEANRMLYETPPMMEALYQDMLESMSRISVGKDVAKAILSWVACALKPLTTR